MMLCPYCKGKTEVVDSRFKGDKIKRRRECVKCHYRFNTYELYADYLDYFKHLEGKKK